MRKKLLVWLAVVIMLMTLIPGAAFAEDQEKYSGKLTYNNMDLGDFSFDFRKITEDDNTKYSDETAILASLLSIDANKGMSMPGMDQANQNIS